MKTSKYRGVSMETRVSGAVNQLRWSSDNPWRASIRFSGTTKNKNFKSERQAAIQYDIWVLENNLDRPLNILRQKKLIDNRAFDAIVITKRQVAEMELDEFIYSCTKMEARS